MTEPITVAETQPGGFREEAAELAALSWFERETIRADIAVFVNAPPLAILELKSPAYAEATLERAYIQLQNHKDKAPELMRCNQVLVISEGIEARIGSLTARQQDAQGGDKAEPYLL
jgi:type I site-specific restriction-modification system R (restriction) subunit